MLTNQFILGIAAEIVVDLFAGGGGASTGIEQAIGRHVDIAVNHDREAVALHRANHPQTQHYICDVFEIDPLAVTHGRPVGLLWASPDCKHFSKAKGGKPVSKKIRGLADVVVVWAKAVRPRIICLENVEEFRTWGPLDDDNLPIASRKGEHFEAWRAKLVAEGYAVEFKELRGCDYGAPTIRKRLFMIARCDGQPIVWPTATHAQKPAKGSGLKPWRTAADCIDWSIECPSIFERQRELAPATMRRIAHGVQRYVLDNPKPYIVRIGQTGHSDGGKVRSIDAPLTTVTTKAEHLLVSPSLATIGYGEHATQAPRVQDINKPLGTIVGAKKHALVAAFMAQHNTGVVGHHMSEPVSTIVGKGCTQALVTANLIDSAHSDVSPSGVKRWSHGNRPVTGPLPTVLASGGNSALVTSNLVKLRGTSNSAATDAPLATVSAGGTHHAEVRAFLMRYFGTEQNPQIDKPLHTITTKDRDAVVTVDVAGEPYYIADIGMRMLQPRELYRAQGFPDTYVIDWGLDEHGQRRPLTKTAQVRMCGNSVCPPLSFALVAANYSDQQPMRRAA